MNPQAETTQYVTLTCRMCHKIVLYSNNPDKLRQYARQHHGTHPGHWLQATTENGKTIDVPNREAE